MKFVFGLGNPDDKYKNTRHNVGRYVVETLASRYGLNDWTYDKYVDAFLAETSIANETVVFVLPETYMNKSGSSVIEILKAWKGKMSDCVVVYDDIDLALGQLRVSFNRGHGGHNGVRSVENYLSSKEFIRLRIGIGQTGWFSNKVKRPASGHKLERFVLGKFSKSEIDVVNLMVDKGEAVLESLIKEGLEKTRNKFN